MGTEEHGVEKLPCFCPYCDTELRGESALSCQACHVEVFYCPLCRKPISRDKRVCPHCGAEIKG